MEAIGRLAGGVAHDFNNILGVILGHCDLMAEQLAGVDQAVPHTTAIRKSAQHAAALTRQLLAFSRKQVMQMQELNLNEVVGALTEMLKRLIGENIELTLDLAPELGMVNADPVQIEQVVMNLVVNARDAMPKGGRITIGTANVELDRAYVSSRPPVLPGSYVMISVSDTGHGMDEATVAHLFEPFFTTKELGRGTGLGLSIIYGIVRQSNGHVLVYTEPGLGSTFKVYLPRLEGPARDKVQSTPSFNVLDQRSETILLVEDDQDLREMIASMLAASGYTVLSASTAKEALTVSESHPGLITLMLTDVVLRGSADGQELSRQIKVQRPNIRILFMSGYSESFVASSSDSANPAELLQKPFSSEELRRRIFRILATPS